MRKIFLIYPIYARIQRSFDCLPQCKGVILAQIGEFLIGLAFIGANSFPRSAIILSGDDIKAILIIRDGALPHPKPVFIISLEVIE